MENEYKELGEGFYGQCNVNVFTFRIRIYDIDYVVCAQREKSITISCGEWGWGREWKPSDCLNP